MNDTEELFSQTSNGITIMELPDASGCILAVDGKVINLSEPELSGLLAVALSFVKSRAMWVDTEHVIHHEVYIITCKTCDKSYKVIKRGMLIDKELDGLREWRHCPICGHGIRVSL